MQRTENLSVLAKKYTDNCKNEQDGGAEACFRPRLLSAAQLGGAEVCFRPRLLPGAPIRRVKGSSSIFVHVYSGVEDDFD